MPDERPFLQRAEAETKAESQAPRVITREVELQAVAAKATATTVVTVAGFAGTVADVEYATNGPVALSATEPRTITVINRGSAGLGSAVVATRSFTTTGSAQIQNKIPLVGSGVAVAPGDVLVAESHDAGATGTSDPGGLFKVVLARTTRVGSGIESGTGYFGSPTLGA
jgi:hypothetical protein